MKLLAIILCSIFVLYTASIKVYLMGGAVSNNETEVWHNLAIATGKTPIPNNCSQVWSNTSCPRIAVITSAAPSQQDGNNAYNVDEVDDLGYHTLFLNFGFSPKHLSVHIDNYEKDSNISTQVGKVNLEIILQADIIFFNGGDQARHARSWLNDDGRPNKMFEVISKRAHQNQVIIAGTSAGSMIMCNPIYGGGISYGHLFFSTKVGLAKKNVIDGGVGGSGLQDIRNGTSGAQYEDNGGMMSGFGFVPFLTDTHFDARGRLGRMISSLVQTRFPLGVGIDESTAFYYDNGTAKVFGKNGVFMIDISNALYDPKTYFAMNNIQLTYLTSGDAFNFKKGQVIASKNKKLIEKPKSQGYVDSSNIFSHYEATRLVTNLVDQTGLYNIGLSKIPSGYPKDAPTFKLTFRQQSYTHGYYSKSENKYLSQNVSISVSYI